MIYETIKAYLHRRPFKPFRIIMKEGKPVDVRGPEGNLLAHTSVIVALVVRKGVVHNWAYLGLEAIVDVVPIPKKRRPRTKRTG